MTSPWPFVVLALLLIPSCSDREVCAGEPVVVNFGIDSGNDATKMSVDDRGICSVSVFVFDVMTGRLEAEGRSESGEISLTVPSGTRLSCHAIVNVPEDALAVPESKNALLDSRVRMEDFPAGLVPMAAGCTSVFEASSRISMPASRLASKIVLDTLECSFMDRMVDSDEVRLVRMFLENVCASEPLSMVPSDGGHWLNRMGLDDGLPSNVRDCLVCELNMPVLSSEPQTIYRSLYCLPNPVSDAKDSSTDPEWSPRCTRLVIEVSVNGKPQYYPVTFGVPMKSNSVYRIKHLRLIGPGSDNPDIPVSSGSVSFAVSVVPWEDAVGKNVTL